MPTLFLKAWRDAHYVLISVAKKSVGNPYYEQQHSVNILVQTWLIVSLLTY